MDTIRFVPANVYQAFTYNPRGWLDTMITKNQFNTLIFRQTFERDEAGSIKHQMSKHQNSALFCDEYYSYDNLNRLTIWSNGADAQSFTYDKMGNRQTDVLNSFESYYTYDDNNPNRLNTYDMKSATQDITKKYDYDGNGSVTLIEINDNKTNTPQKERFNYNYAGLPISYIKFIDSETVTSFCSGTNASRNSSKFIWDYHYSPLGGREQKKLSKSPLGDFCKEDANYHGWTYYALGAEGEQLTVYKGVQESWETGTRKVTFYAHSYLTCGGILVTLPDSTKQFNVFDHLGSARVKISVKNNVIVSTQGFNYMPFGDTLRCTGTDRVGFIGKELDEENNYFLFGVRNYDKQTGRFLSVDPLWESFRNYTPYHYSYNNPISFKDPTGFAPEKEGDELQGKKDCDKLMLLSTPPISFELYDNTAYFLSAEIEQYSLTLNVLLTYLDVCNTPDNEEIAKNGAGGAGGGGGGGGGTGNTKDNINTHSNNGTQQSNVAGKQNSNKSRGYGDYTKSYYFSQVDYLGVEGAGVYGSYHISGDISYNSNTNSLFISACGITAVDGLDYVRFSGWVSLYIGNKFIAKKSFTMPKGDFLANPGFFGSVIFYMPLSFENVSLIIRARYTLISPEGITEPLFTLEGVLNLPIYRKN